ncbi:MAG: protease modulator HflC [Alphaproteobacteria bacterium]
MQRLLIIGGVAAALLLVVLANCFYIVRVDEQAIVLQFGQAKAVVNAGDSKQDGLHFKWPVVQNVLTYDKKNLGYDLQAQEIIGSDQQRLIVDAIARYRIRDPLQFFRAAQTEAIGEAQLSQRMVAALRGELGKVATPDIVSGQRAQLMQKIKGTLNANMASFGVEVVDVRIRRADLPKQNAERVFERMKSELQQKAKLYRAEGEEQYSTIKGDADRQTQVIVATAQEQSQKTRGEGDAQRNAIYASAYNKDAEFFAFYRSMQAYENSIKEGTPIVISPESDFFKYFTQAPK